MHIRQSGNSLLMSESLVCPNYSDMKHFRDKFEKIGDNEYKCGYCGAVMTISEPVLVHVVQDEHGRLHMEVRVDVTESDIKRY